MVLFKPTNCPPIIGKRTRVPQFIAIWLYAVCMFPCSSGVLLQGTTLHLERGSEGKITCPVVTALELTPEDINSIYWYTGPIDESLPRIKNCKGETSLGEGVAAGLYDIDENLNLVIQTVLDSSASTYYCRLIPNSPETHESSVSVEVIVTPDLDGVFISPCDGEITDPCKIYIPRDQNNFNLICKVEHAKPAVALEVKYMHRDYGFVSTPLESNDTTASIVIPSTTTLTESEILKRNNTFTTTVSAQVDVGIGEYSLFICVASNKAIWKNSQPSKLAIVTRGEVVAEYTQKAAVPEPTSFTASESTSPVGDFTTGTPVIQADQTDYILIVLAVASVLGGILAVLLSLNLWLTPITRRIRQKIETV